MLTPEMRRKLFGEEASNIDISDEEEEYQPADISTPVTDKPFWLDEHAGYLNIQYLLKPDIPERYYKELSKYLLAIDKLTALGNIRREDILRFKILFRMVIQWYKLGLPRKARQLLTEFIFEMQLSRSVDGFERVMQATQRSESISEERGRPPPSRTTGILTRLFGGKKQRGET